MFPDNLGNAIATGVSNLWASLLQTFQHRVCDAMAVQKYIIHRVEDVTEFVRLTQPGNEQQRVTEDLRSRIGEMEAESFHRAVHIQEVNG